jgi:hypothetical protein
MAKLGQQHTRKGARKGATPWKPGDPGLYRPAPSFRGDVAEKLWTALELTNVSASTLFIELINRLQVDEEGWPLDEHGQRMFVQDQEELPLTG